MGHRNTIRMLKIKILGLKQSKWIVETNTVKTMMELGWDILN